MDECRLPALRWLACLLVAVCPHALASLRMQAGTEGLTVDERIASGEILSEVDTRLPASMRERLGVVDVQWRDDLPEHVAGRAFSTAMRIDRHLLDAWITRTPATAHSNQADHPEQARRAALAAVIHEIAHLYDLRTHLSRDSRLLDLAGWQVAPMKFGLRASHTAFTDRMPDRYETASPREFFAVNLEHLLLDPDYPCRRPQMAAWFVQRLGLPPHSSACAPGIPFFEADADAPLLELDPARVYGIDYLLAEGNDQLLSRWGHSMLRLVICAPGHARGPGCRYDLAYHRVLSFRAFVDDVQVSSVRGLTGAYPSRLFVLPLSQVIAEYTQVQLRGLQSIPLKLDDDEIVDLLQRAAQVHWSYDGRYRFIGNNCAVETFKLLHDSVPRLADAHLSSITPNGLLDRLQRAGVADTSVLHDPQAARRQGFYFESEVANYQTLFDIARKSLSLPQRDVHDWLALAATRRGPVFASADLRNTAALLLLEQAALRQEEQGARDVLKRRLLARDAIVGEREAVRSLLDEDAQFARPAALLSGGGGYGLPQTDERAQLLRDVQPRLQRQAQARDGLLRQARGWLPSGLREEMAEIERDLATLGARARMLQRAEGGITLPR